ncbi:hypothetical protein COC63_06940 [Bacillus cereus]|nr:hypothetical protein COC63_06940 [Bacillus cereus]
MQKKTKIVSVLLTGLILVIGGLLVQAYMSKSKLEVEKGNLAKMVKNLKEENSRLEGNLATLRENTREKGQEVAKNFVVAVNRFDPKEDVEAQKAKVKPLVTGQAESKLFQVTEDAHHEGEVTHKTHAEVKDMYYTKTADNKADVIVTYDFVIVGEDGSEQREVHNMKINIENAKGTWVVTDFTVHMQTGVEGL